MNSITDLRISKKNIGEVQEKEPSHTLLESTTMSG